MTKGRYTQRFTMHLNYGRGAHGYSYDILDGEKVIGAKYVSSKRGKVESVTYAIGTLTFDSAKDFIKAYEDSIAPKPEGEEAA
jgi:hypothetical protein